MYQPDFENFSKLMHMLAEVFSKKLTDEIVAAYWKALKDRPYSSVAELAEKHARHGKFFPKPFELRPKGDRPQEKRDSRLDKADIKAIERLENLRRQNPEAWFKEFENHNRQDCFAVELARRHGVHNIHYNFEVCSWMVTDEVGTDHTANPAQH